MSDHLLSLEKAKDNMAEKDLKAIQDHQRNQLFSDSVKKNFNAKELAGMAMRSKIKEKIFYDKLETHVELIRRKLDFTVIRDNQQNKTTQQILDRFTDLRAGMPGTNYKFIKLQELINQRNAELRLNAERAKLEREEIKAREKAKTKFERKAVDIKFEQKRKTLDNKSK